jgi:MFS family permease
MMQAAGLSLATASGLAGARGAFQIPGRLFLTPLTDRFGIRASIGLCYALAATATLALLLAVGLSSLAAALYFAAFSGMALGMLSPLNGLFQAEVYGDERLGTLSGVGVVVSSLAAAAGAAAAGILEEATGSYSAPLLAILALQALAIAALLWQGAVTSSRPSADIEAAAGTA